jgi:hypothetical protein
MVHPVKISNIHYHQKILLYSQGLKVLTTSSVTKKTKRTTILHFRKRRNTTLSDLCQNMYTSTTEQLDQVFRLEASGLKPCATQAEPPTHEKYIYKKER